MCAYACARGRVIIAFFTIKFSVFVFSFFYVAFPLPNIHRKRPVVLKKQHVIFEETIRRFRKNNTSFSRKQHVVFEETTRRKKNGGVAKMSFAASPLGVSRRDKRQGIKWEQEGR